MRCGDLMRWGFNTITFNAFRARVSNFSQAEARKHCLLASDTLKFVTSFPENTVVYDTINNSDILKICVGRKTFHVATADP